MDTLKMDIKDLRDKNASGTLNKTQQHKQFSVLASPRPFSYFSAVLHIRTSICTTAVHLAPARCHSDVSHMPTRIPTCPLAFPLRAHCFLHDRLLFPACPFATLRACRFPHTCSLPRASSPTSRFLLCLASLHFAWLGFAERGAKRDKTGYCWDQ
ncbi:hypothetical protein B0H13DRAFT_2301816 [Mycena leptocephala]|nr:hypothetical protein B0H13DRAFT_2301816 [Mycena leptocephala]